MKFINNTLKKKNIINVNIYIIEKLKKKDLAI